ncbi:MAG: hypothetical protein AAGF11_18385 [Myxococcota bacterium]
MHNHRSLTAISTIFGLLLTGATLGGCDQADSGEFDGEALEIEEQQDSEGMVPTDEEELDMPDGADELVNETPVTEIDNGFHKICSVIGNGWRDTLVVPDNWDAGDCNTFRVATGAITYQLGCFRFSTFTFGIAGGTPPSENCGW